MANAAVESGLYDVTDHDGQPTDAAELILGDIEAKVAPGFDALVSGPWPPEREVRGLVANFIAGQVTRTRESLHVMAAITDGRMPRSVAVRDMTDAVATAKAAVGGSA